MGNCFSDPSHSKPGQGKGQGQKLGSGPAQTPAGGGGGQRLGESAGNAPQNTGGMRYNDPPRPLGGGGVGGGGGSANGEGLSEAEQRDRMLRAAEERAKAVSAN